MTSRKVAKNSKPFVYLDDVPAPVRPLIPKRVIHGGGRSSSKGEGAFIGLILFVIGIFALCVWIIMTYG